MATSRKATRPKKGKVKVANTKSTRSAELKRLEKIVSKKYAKQAMKQKELYARSLRKVTLSNKKRIISLLSRHNLEKRRWKKKLKEELNRKNESFEREFSRLKKNNQLQAEQLRSVYRDQYNFTISELRTSFCQQIEAASKVYSDANESSKLQLTKLQQWLQEELITQLLEKKHQLASSEADQVRLAAELKINKLKEQLENRESQIQASKERMQHLEDKVAGKYARALWSKLRGAGQADQGVTDQRQQHQEDTSDHGQLLKIVKEISKEKAEMDEQSGEPDSDQDDGLSSLLQTWNSDRPRRLD